MINLVPEKSKRQRSTHGDTKGDDARHYFQGRQDRPRIVSDGEHRRVDIKEQLQIIESCKSPLVQLLFQGIDHKDMPWELAVSRDRFAGNDTFSIYYCPMYLKTCVDRLRRIVISENGAPNTSVATSALISYGLDTLTRSSMFRMLSEIGKRFDESEDTDGGRTILELKPYFDRMELTVTDMSGTGSVKNYNCYITEQIRRSLLGASNAIGLSGSHLAQICIMIGLFDQVHPSVLPAYREYLEHGLDSFLRRMRLRAKIGHVLISEIVECEEDEDSHAEEEEL